MLSQAPTPAATFSPHARSSNPSPPPTSSARKRLSGLINLRSTANSLLPSREPSTSGSSARNSNRHSIHGAIFRSSSIRGSSASRNRARSSVHEDSTFIPTFPDTFDPVEYLAEPVSITLEAPLVEPTIPAPQQPDDSDPANRRFSTRFCESAAAALLLERTSENSSPEPPAEWDMTRSRSATLSTLTEMSPESALPSIRLSAFYDTRSNRPSLSFTPMTRTLPTGKEIIKVGRYSERENHAPVPINTPSAAAVGFKSKVVSRRHCEFWSEKGKWYIKDVKSSSGTFLNHIRLSAPGTESKPYPVNDGDIVQLGIDFKGGEEMIYRCVKMRVELNRGWQAKPNTFNMATHKRLRDLTAATSSTAHAQDCSICLNAIAPCQSLFVAPCSHTWHFKCIRDMLHGPTWPIFMCPNCRATADLDADVDEPVADWEEVAEEIPEEQEGEDGVDGDEGASTKKARNSALALLTGVQEEPEATVQVDRAPIATSTSSTRSNPMPIPNATARRTPSPTGDGLLNPNDGPITPRNEAGPFILDGNHGRVSHESTRRAAMASLNAAAQPYSNVI